MKHLGYPSLYQINTRVWLRSISNQRSNLATLDDFPEKEIERIAGLGFNWVWLLGVWKTGEAGRRISRTKPELLGSYEEALADVTEDDICGSCFAITGYIVNPVMGGEAALLRLRERLRVHDLRLMLDFIPNHVATDHPWVQDHPEYFISGSELDLENQIKNFGRTPKGDHVLAFGRDPYFPGWSDTFQLNYGNPDLQAAMTTELKKIAGMCDGVRCDMAMLVLPEIFERTWGIASEPFWPRAIQTVHEELPEFLFMAEVYWDLEWTLQQQGFDYTYDKRLYDRLRDKQAKPVREHLKAEMGFQEKLARFLENHDEPRAATTFPADVHKASAVITYFTPGLRFFHQGQLEGRKKHIPVHLCRGPIEPVDAEISLFYDKLLEALKQPDVRDGEWQLLECQPAWDNNWTWDNFISFAWIGEGRRIMGTVNFSPYQSQCYVQVPFPDIEGKIVRLEDLLGVAVYERYGDDLIRRGLYLDLPPWNYHLFNVRID